MRKRWTAIGLVGCLLVGMLAGCSGSGQQETTAGTGQETVQETASQGAAEDAAAESTGEEITITMSHWGSETDEKTYRERADLYESTHPGIKIEMNYMPSDHIQKLNTMFAGGTAPDIVVLAEDIHSFSSKGLLLPLDEYVQEAGIDLEARVGKTAVDTYSYDGQLYGIADRGGSMVLFYNKDMFDEAGLDYPTADWKWEDMLEAAQAMTGGTGEEETWGFGLETWWPYWMTWIYQSGGRVIDEEGNLVINSPESVKGLTFIQELTTVYDVVPTREEYANMGSGAAAGTVFAQGKIGMVPNGLWFFSSLQDVDFNYDVVELFGGDYQVTAPFGSAMTISKTCEHPDIAFDIINFMTDVEAQQVIVKNLEDAPANLEVLASDEFKNAGWTSESVDIEVFSRSSEMVYTPPVGANWSSWDTIFSDELAGVFDGTVDPQTALDNIEKRINEG